MSEQNLKKETWPIIRDLFSGVIIPAKNWPEADCLGDINDMARHFHEAFPEQECNVEDMRIALHDMNIPYERNEHNNKFYYLAKWR